MLGSYTGTRLHGVSEITHKVAGLVLSLVAAGQLSEVLAKAEKHRPSLRC